MPTTDAPAGVIPRNAPVVVAHFEAAEMSFASVPQLMFPVASDLRSQFAALSAETMRFVVEARVAVTFVVEAYGATREDPENERKDDEVSCPPVVANGIRPERSEERKRSVDEEVVKDPKPAESAVDDANGVVTDVPAAVTSEVPLKYTEFPVVVNDEALVPPRAIDSVPAHVGAKVKVPPEFVMERLMLVSDEVARVSAPVCAEPKVCWRDETPLLIDEVATQVGIPLKSARTWPLVPAEVVLIAPEPFPKSTVFAWSDAQPVPPEVVGRMPVTSEARSTRPVETAPAVARRMPVRFAIESVFDTLSAEVEANPLTERFEVVAFEETRFVVVPVVTERFEIEEELFTTIPIVEVGVRAPETISHDLPKSCDASA